MEKNEKIHGMKIFIGSDRIGFHLKHQLVTSLSEKYEVIDCGPFEYASVHYPTIAFDVSERIRGQKRFFGILICSTGTGMCIAANKIKRIRAANCLNIYLAQHSRLHNDANVLCLGSDLVDFNVAVEIAHTFLSTQFEGGKHIERIKLIDEVS